MASGQELFDSILLADEKYRGEGFRDGFMRGTRRGLQDGRRHGTVHGSRVSSERSFYHGFAIAWKCLLDQSTDHKYRKQLKVLKSLLGLIQSTLLNDPQSVNLQNNTQKVRAKFRQVCSMLSVPTDFKEYIHTPEAMSF